MSRTASTTGFASSPAGSVRNRPKWLSAAPRGGPLTQPALTWKSKQLRVSVRPGTSAPPSMHAVVRNLGHQILVVHRRDRRRRRSPGSVAAHAEAPASGPRPWPPERRGPSPGRFWASVFLGARRPRAPARGPASRAGLLAARSRAGRALPLGKCSCYGRKGLVLPRLLAVSTRAALICLRLEARGAAPRPPETLLFTLVDIVPLSPPSDRARG